jgi:hypothetical protein
MKGWRDMGTGSVREKTRGCQQIRH